jgi:hypothetical protein
MKLLFSLFVQCSIVTLVAISPSIDANPLIATSTNAGATTPFLGRWEIVDTMHTSKLSRRDVGTEERSVGTMGRVYDFQQDYVIDFGNKLACRFDPDKAGLRVPIAALFQKESASKQAPAWISYKFRDRVRNYRLGSLAHSTVALYRYKCQRSDPENRPVRLNSAGNWLAVVGDIMIFPSSDEWLFILKRPPKERVPEHSAFCAQASSANDKTICEDREMWLMNSVASNYTDCMLKDRTLPAIAQRDEEFADLALRKQACVGNRNCLYRLLEEWVGSIARYSSRPDETCKR